MILRLHGSFSVLLAAVSLGTRLPANEPAPKRLVEASDASLAAARVHGLKASLARGPGRARLRLETSHRTPWPGIAFAAPPGDWDLSPFAHVSVQVRNAGSAEGRVGLRIDSRAGDPDKPWTQEVARIGPGETATLRVRLRRRMPAVLSGKLFGMRGYPGGLTDKGGLDTTRVTKVRVFLERPGTDHVIEIGAITAGGRPPHPLPEDPARWFPMIDRYGQYMHSDWPRKTHSDADLAMRRRQEALDLDTHTGPGDWNRYGGWETGPRRKANGFFRVEKIEGKWWLIDPEGCLFWSHGIDCVGLDSAVTPITDREFWFADLPEPGAPLAFYGRGSWAPHGHYSGKSYRTYGFGQANLLRKYGGDWREQTGTLAHRRLRSWGLNTIGNWSDPQICSRRKTPYVVAIHTPAPTLEGSTGYWGKFPDVFDPEFRERLRGRMAQEKGASAGDPWCLGYFVGNELSWGDEPTLAQAALASPPDQPAKSAFIDDLRRKYTSIEELNRAWGTRHASWHALVESRVPADATKARADLAAFVTRTAEQYFRVSREEVKEVAPRQLYLGCRFAWVNDRAVQAAARHCDVIGYNLYRDAIRDFHLPAGLDRPVIVGEFHFGALDRGMLHTGLRPVATQADRAYEHYVTGALRNPLIVGTHWFQYADQATTGRGDGENYQIGFIDVCDTPYPETIDASRRVAAGMYRVRMEP